MWEELEEAEENQEGDTTRVLEELEEAEGNQEGDTTGVLEKSSCFTDSVRKTGGKTRRWILE